MIKTSMFLGKKCPKCGYEKLNVIKELELSKYECKCENCRRKSIVNLLTNETTLIN